MILINDCVELWSSFWILKSVSKTQKETGLFHPARKSVWFHAVLLHIFVCIIVVALLLVVTKHRGVFLIFNPWCWYQCRYIFHCSSAVRFKGFSPPYCLSPPVMRSSWLMWHFQSLELLAVQETSCDRSGYKQVSFPHPSLAAKSSQSSESTTCLSLRPQMWLNSLLPSGWPRKHTCLHILPQATHLG